MRDFSTTDINLTAKPAEPIYINESLSYSRRQLFNAARELKKEKKFKFLWVRNGRILLRAEEGAKAIVITTMDQIADLRKI